jgi:hypothetical protein
MVSEEVVSDWDVAWMCLIGGYEDIKCPYPCCDKDRIKRTIPLIGSRVHNLLSNFDTTATLARSILRTPKMEISSISPYHLVFLDIIFYFISCLRSPTACILTKSQLFCPAGKPFLTPKQYM